MDRWRQTDRQTDRDRETVVVRVVGVGEGKGGAIASTAFCNKHHDMGHPASACR